MFIINLTYKVPLEDVDTFLSEHIIYLKQQYQAGHFIASGRKVPRTGGIILSTVKTETELQAVLNQDPFMKHNLADYEVTEFVPSMTAEALSFLKE
ncbi:MAG: YciI family protein [Bacteroidota bacterium]